MGLLKVLGILFLLIIIVLGVIGVDGYMTYNSLQGAIKDPTKLASSPKYTVGSGNKNITLSVSVAIPKGGFIPKGIQLTVNVNFAGEVQSKTQTINLGDNKTISMVFQLTSATISKLANGGSITVSANIKVTLVYLGLAIPPASITKNLGSQTVTGLP